MSGEDRSRGQAGLGVRFLFPLNRARVGCRPGPLVVSSARAAKSGAGAAEPAYAHLFESSASRKSLVCGTTPAMSDLAQLRYHVTPSVNRESIVRFGLDWKKMGADQRGIAQGWPGQPEADGIFLTAPDIEDARWFARMGAVGESTYGASMSQV